MDKPRIAVELLIHGGWILTMDGQRREFRDGALAIAEGQIVAVGPTAEVRSRYRGEREIDAGRRLVLPGLVNAHNHLFQVMCRGLGEGADLSTWAQRAIWPVAPFLDQAACEVAASLACLEMIESGTTTVVDSHYLHADPGAQDGIARACLRSGLRAILGRAAMDADSIAAPFRETPAQAVRATERFIQRWHRRSGRLYVRPEAMNELTASRELILLLRALSQAAGVGFHMHVSEARARPELVRRRTGFRTIEYLDRLGVLGSDVVLAHCVWLDEREQEILGATGTAVAHNPISNQFLADGVAPVPELLERGVRVGLGTDGAASNDAQDMFQVMKAASQLQKVHHLRADLFPAPQVLEAATAGGAEALGLREITGSLEVGKQADVLLLNLDEPGMIPAYSVVSNLVHSASSRAVDTVIVAGRILAQDGVCVSLDRGEIVREARQLAAHLATKL